MARLRIEDIPEEGLHLQLAEQEPELLRHLPHIDFSLDGPVRADLTINKSDKAVLITGWMEAGLILQCSRCLEEYRFALTAHYEVTLFPFEAETPPQDAELNGDDLRSSYYYGGEVDLSAIIREQILLDIPYKPLCRPSCKGLCPTCGENLNRESCSCEEAAFDERFAPLKGLTIGRGRKGN